MSCSSADAVLFATREELAGLSDAEIVTAASAAKAACNEGQFLLLLVNNSGQPPLTRSLQSHASREKFMATSLVRGGHGVPFDNTSLVSAIAKRRAEHAALMGYPHHAAYQLTEQTVGSVDTLNRLLAQLAAPAVANARKEQAAMQAVVDAEKDGFALRAADWPYYTERVRAAR